MGPRQLVFLIACTLWAACSGAASTDRGGLAPGSGSPPLGGTPAGSGGLPTGSTPGAGPGVAPPGSASDCGSISVDPVATYGNGNLLVIFDRSMSMAGPFDGATNRLTAARTALKSALAPLVCDSVTNPDGAECVDRISVALLTFPTQDDTTGLNETQFSCNVDDLGTPEQLDWRPVSVFYVDFDPYWDSRTLNPGGQLFPGNHPLLFGTPTSVAFARADAALRDPNLMGNKAVLFLTDGEETGGCTDGVNSIATAGQWWEQLGIPTYVVSMASGEDPLANLGLPPGLIPPGVLPGGGQMFNEQVAMAGGTSQPINPADAEGLAQEIQRIVMDTVGQTSCEVVLTNGSLVQPALACEQGSVFVGPTRVPCDQDNRQSGFFVKSENTIELVGEYCNQLKRDRAIEATFPCTVVVL